MTSLDCRDCESPNADSDALSAARQPSGRICPDRIDLLSSLIFGTGGTSAFYANECRDDLAAAPLKIIDSGVEVEIKGL